MSDGIIVKRPLIEKFLRDAYKARYILEALQCKRNGDHLGAAIILSNHFPEWQKIAEEMELRWHET